MLKRAKQSHSPWFGLLPFPLRLGKFEHVQEIYLASSCSPTQASQSHCILSHQKHAKLMATSSPYKAMLKVDDNFSLEDSQKFRPSWLEASPRIACLCRPWQESVKIT